MKKRLVAYLLTMTLVAGMLTGCGGSKTEAADMSAPASETTSEETVTGMEYTTEEAPAEEAPMYDNAVRTETVTEAPEAEYTDAEEAKLADREEKENGYLESCYDIDVEAANGEEYSEWEEKGYSSVMKAPLSTFSADVDTASYSNLRRMIMDGYTLEDIPEGAVRIEELLNYFSYDYEEPEEPVRRPSRRAAAPVEEEEEDSINHKGKKRAKSTYCLYTVICRE